VLLAAFCVLAALVVALAVLPASVAARFLPPQVSAQEYSGSLWHGSAAQIRVLGREAGALEWELHPAALLHLDLEAQLHWVLGGFVLDGRLTGSGHTLTLTQLEGGGPIEDLHGLGVPADCHGIARVSLSMLEASLQGAALALRSVSGTLEVSDLVLPAVGGSADLGTYVLEVPPTTSPGTDLNGRLHDAGGLLGLEAAVRYSPQSHLGTLSGTVTPRGELPPGLRRALDSMAALHAPDPGGGIPVDLEFTL
jgi:hypothetical protein